LYKGAAYDINLEPIREKLVEVREKLQEQQRQQHTAHNNSSALPAGIKTPDVPVPISEAKAVELEAMANEQAKHGINVKALRNMVAWIRFKLEEQAREDTAREDTAREDTAREDTAREDTAREDTAP